LIDSILLLLTIPFTFGKDPNLVTLADLEQGLHFAVLAQPIWAWSMAAIKSAVALMLLRISTTVPMRRFLWSQIAIQVLLGIYNMVAQMTQCIPLYAVWDLSGNSMDTAKCWSTDAQRISIIAVATVNIVTDFMFALVPISFLKKVQRPLREKLVVGILMALGIFAGVASIIKANAATRFGRTDDPTLEGIEIGMWSCVEQLIGLIAACVPCLRSPFQRALEYFGVISSTQSKSPRSGYDRTYTVVSGKLRDTTPGNTVIEGGSLRSSLILLRNMKSAETLRDGMIEDIKDNEIWCTTEVEIEERSRTPRFASGETLTNWTDVNVDGSVRPGAHAI
jgi:hypothetical protein